MKMNNRIARFQRVSFEQFLEDYSKETHLDIHNAEAIKMVRKIWDNIKLPIRKTKCSAGYDINSTMSFKLEPNQTILIPTGIKCEMDEDWFLMVCPRSGLGFKYRMQLDNTLGIIDSDYFFSDNEGHIMLKITNDSKSFKTLDIKEGDGIAQGIFLPYGITVDDDAQGVRNGGFGSTDRK